RSLEVLVAVVPDTVLVEEGLCRDAALRRQREVPVGPVVRSRQEQIRTDDLRVLELPRVLRKCLVPGRRLSPLRAGVPSELQFVAAQIPNVKRVGRNDLPV